jgi:hypothetical protein
MKALVKLSDFQQWQAVSQQDSLGFEHPENHTVKVLKSEKKSKPPVDKPAKRTYRTYFLQQIQELIDLVMMVGMSA